MNLTDRQTPKNSSLNCHGYMHAVGLIHDIHSLLYESLEPAETLVTFFNPSGPVSAPCAGERRTGEQLEWRLWKRVPRAETNQVTRCIPRE